MIIEIELATSNFSSTSGLVIIRNQIIDYIWIQIIVDTTNHQKKKKDILQRILYKNKTIVSNLCL